MRALVTGADGQLGRALVETLGDRVAYAAGRDRLDVTDAAAVLRAVENVGPDVVFNATAYNGVDAAESEPLAALAVNAAGAHHLARAARAAGAVIVHVSTDYVFDGARSEPYSESDATGPLGAYGVSKLAGELLVMATHPEHLIVRTSGVLGRGGSRTKGGSFVERIVLRARSGAPLRVVSDQVFSPTYAPDLAEAMVALVEAGARGVVHVANAGRCTWHALACAALETAGIPAHVTAIDSSELGAAARRPRFSVLGTARYSALTGRAMRSWRETLPALLA
jgi:dTDP-4-dehydrorhamnose reductase